MAEEAVKVTNAPVRIVCRYANGIVQSAIARGISLKDDVLRVFTREAYEVGVQVTVMSAILPHASMARVTAKKRGEEPGSFVIDLLLRESLGHAPKAEALEEGSSEAFRAAANALAERLYSAGRVPYRQAAFDGASPADRPLYLAATEKAVFTLLAEKGLADMKTFNAKIERQKKP